MNLDITDLLVWATKRTFSAMLDWEIERDEDVDSSSLDTAISGIVGLSGDVTGSIVLILPEPLAIGATEGLIGESLATINGDVIDTIGELTNIIAGGAKSKIELTVNVSLPTVITGGQHTVAFDSQASPTLVYFSTQGRRFGVKYCIDAPARIAISNATALLAV